MKYTTRQKVLDHSKRSAQDLSVESASKHFGRSYNTAIFEMIARFKFPYSFILCRTFKNALQRDDKTCQRKIQQSY